MTRHQHVRPAYRARAVGLAGLVLLLTAGVALAVLLRPSSTVAPPSRSTAPSSSGTPAADSGQGVPARDEDGPSDGEGPRRGDHVAPPAGPGGATVLDDTDPGVAHLDDDLLAALRDAAAEAADDGVTFHVNSGWRSAELQTRLFDEAVAEYGSAEEAARWVATAETSAHVSGDAVDLGPTAATAWLSQHGARYGLCQVYANEPWHYELFPDAADAGCPDMYADPTEDPRMQQ